MTIIDRLDKIHPDLISAFLSTGQCDGIPEDVKLFLKQIQWAAEIYEYERNISRAARQLRIRILAQQKISLDERTCRARIYAAINYFNIDNNVSIKVWEDNFAKLSAMRGDYKTQKECYKEALECRRRASQIAEATTNMGIVFLFSKELTAEELGYTSENLKKIAAKYNEGFYHNLISNLPIEKEEKKRLLRDADIQEAEIVEEYTEE